MVRICGRVIRFALRHAELSGLVVEWPLELVERALDDCACLAAIAAFVFADTFGPNGAMSVRPSAMLP